MRRPTFSKYTARLTNSIKSNISAKTMNLMRPQILLERWKWLPEYNVYVSSLGHFKSKDKKALDIKVNDKGYALVYTDLGLKLSHRLVLQAFKPTIAAGDLTVDHIDHNKRNNTIKNLRWLTREENLRLGQKDHIHTEVQGCTEIPTIGVNDVKVEKAIGYLDNRRSVVKASSLMECVSWLLENDPTVATDKNQTLKKLADGVSCAVRNKTLYYGYYWYVEGV